MYLLLFLLWIGVFFNPHFIIKCWKCWGQIICLFSSQIFAKIGGAAPKKSLLLVDMTCVTHGKMDLGPDAMIGWLRGSWEGVSLFCMWEICELPPEADHSSLFVEMAAITPPIFVCISVGSVTLAFLPLRDDISFPTPKAETWLCQQRSV